jgi:hypothetical protein
VCDIQQLHQTELDLVLTSVVLSKIEKSYKQEKSINIIVLFGRISYSIWFGIQAYSQFETKHVVSGDYHSLFLRARFRIYVQRMVILIGVLVISLS